MRWMHKYVLNRNVFRDCLKLFPPITGFCKLSGREFQIANFNFNFNFNLTLIRRSN